jgi:hypothetical protein
MASEDFGRYHLADESIAPAGKEIISLRTRRDPFGGLPPL